MPVKPPDATYLVSLLLANGETTQSQWLCWDEADSAESDHVCLTLQFAGREITQIAETYWEAFSTIRRELEQEGILVQCYGGNKNVYPSGMAVSMGTGALAYRLIEGQPAKMTDLVDIFSSSPDVIPVTVSEQEMFFQEWLKSLTERSLSQ